MRKSILFLIALFALIGSLRAQEVQADSKVDKEKVRVGEPFTLDLSFQVPKGSVVKWNDKLFGSLSDEIDIVESGVMRQTYDADSNVILKQQLTLMAFDTGQIQVPAIALPYTIGDSIPMQAITKPIDVYVSTISVDTTMAFKPIVEPIAAPVQLKEILPWALGAVLLVLLAVGIWYWLKHRKPKKDTDGNIDRGPVIPPYDKAIGELKQLREEKIWQSGKVKEYFSSLTDIVREYIEGQFGVNAVEMTTDDILDEIKPIHFPAETYDKLKDTMEVADLVKFAKYTASTLECDTALSSMTEFVNESYAHDQKQKAEEEAARKAQSKKMKQDEVVGKEDEENV